MSMTTRSAAGRIQTLILMTMAALPASVAAGDNPAGGARSGGDLPDVLHCPRCDDDEAAARALGSGRSRAYIYDLGACTLRNLLVQDPGGASVPQVMTIPVPPRTRELWQTLCKLHEQTGSLTVTRFIEADDLGLPELSAYDVVITRYAARDIIDALETRQPLLASGPESAAYGLFLEADGFGLPFALEDHSARLEIVLRFSDGSRATFEQHVHGLSNEPHYVQASARDAGGNRIPEENSSHYALSYDFSAHPGDAARWEEALRRFTVPIENPRSRRARCEWQDHTLACAYL